MSTRNRVIILTVLGALLVIGSWWRFGGHETPPGQPPLLTIDTAGLATIKSAFNEASDRTRAIVIISPT
jgi:hypothetical protein